MSQSDEKYRVYGPNEPRPAVDPVTFLPIGVETLDIPTPLNFNGSIRIPQVQSIKIDKLDANYPFKRLSMVANEVTVNNGIYPKLTHLKVIAGRGSGIHQLINLDLEYLSTSTEETKELSEAISHLQKLKVLEINRFCVPNALFPHLEVLSFGNCEIQDKFILGNFPALRDLTLTKATMKELHIPNHVMSVKLKDYCCIQVLHLGTDVRQLTIENKCDTIINIPKNNHLQHFHVGVSCAKSLIVRGDALCNLNELKIYCYHLHFEPLIHSNLELFDTSIHGDTNIINFHGKYIDAILMYSRLTLTDLTDVCVRRLDIQQTVGLPNTNIVQEIELKDVTLPVEFKVPKCLNFTASNCKAVSNVTYISPEIEKVTFMYCDDLKEISTDLPRSLQLLEVASCSNFRRCGNRYYFLNKETGWLDTNTRVAMSDSKFAHEFWTDMIEEYADYLSTKPSHSKEYIQEFMNLPTHGKISSELRQLGINKFDDEFYDSYFRKRINSKNLELADENYKQNLQKKIEEFVPIKIPNNNKDPFDNCAVVGYDISAPKGITTEPISEGDPLEE